MHADYLTPCGTQLGHWYTTLKGKFDSNTLEAHKEATLVEMIGAPLDQVWSTPDVALRWKNVYELFATFYQKMSRNPSKAVEFQSRRIGLWTHRLSSRRKGGRLEVGSSGRRGRRC